MTFNEIITRLQAEGITPQAFSNDYFATLSAFNRAAIHEEVAWLGEVHLVARRADSPGKDMLTLTYHLPQHDIHFETVGTCLWEPAEKDYDPATTAYQEALVAWSQKHPNARFDWEFWDHYSPVKPVTKTVVDYQYAPELKEAQPALVQ